MFALIATKYMYRSPFVQLLGRRETGNVVAIAPIGTRKAHPIALWVFSMSERVKFPHLGPGDPNPNPRDIINGQNPYHGDRPHDQIPKLFTDIKSLSYSEL